VTIQDLGAIGELVAAIATVATLAYLAVQIRQNTRTVETGAAASYSSSVNQVTALLAADQELTDLYFAGLQDPASLSPEKTRRFHLALGMYANQLEQAVLLDKSLPSGWVQSALSQLEWLVTQPGFGAFWSEWRLSHSPSFREYVEKRYPSLRPGS
jgi:hypothetical protein